MYFGKAQGLAELQRMISQGLLHKLLCSGLFAPKPCKQGAAGCIIQIGTV